MSASSACAKASGIGVLPRLEQVLVLDDQVAVLDARDLAELRVVAGDDLVAFHLPPLPAGGRSDGSRIGRARYSCESDGMICLPRPRTRSCAGACGRDVRRPARGRGEGSPAPRSRQGHRGSSLIGAVGEAVVLGNRLAVELPVLDAGAGLDELLRDGEGDEALGVVRAREGERDCELLLVPPVLLDDQVVVLDARDAPELCARHSLRLRNLPCEQAYAVRGNGGVSWLVSAQNRQC